MIKTITITVFALFTNVILPYTTSVMLVHIDKYHIPELKL